jgi:hypothetical protein
MEEAATGEEIHVHTKYVGHIAVMAGRIRETITLPARSTITDLLSVLDENYPGFKEVFMPPAGVFNSRTGIICRRLPQPGFGVVDENLQLRNGDILTLW